MTYEQFKNSYPDGPWEAVEVLNDSSLESAFKELGCQEWIDAFAVYTDGHIDIEATANKVGVPVNYDLAKINPNNYSSGGILSGVPEDDSFEIHLSDRLNFPKEWNITFGHELGHLFIITALDLPRQALAKEEQFCDYFGIRLAIPKTELDSMETVDEDNIVLLAERLGVDHGAIMLRLMEERIIPRQFLMDTNYPVGVPNLFFNGKVRREVMCYKCFMQTPHQINTDRLPKMDFTRHEVSDSRYQSASHRLFAPGHRDSWHISVNEEYDRWSDEDRPMLEEKLRSEEDMLRRMARAAGLNAANE